VEVSIVDASWVYLIDCAIGSSSASCGNSLADTEREDPRIKPAVAKEETWRKLRRAMFFIDWSLDRKLVRESIGQSFSKSLREMRTGNLG